MNLPELLTSPSGFVSLYGTTPPRADTTDAVVDAAAVKLSERLAGLGVQGIVVYDVQEEAGRTEQPRPFPFLPTRASRDYAQLISRTADKPCVVYKSAADMTSDAWEDWLTETAQRYDVGCLSIVGKATSRSEGGTPLLTAMRAAAEHLGGFCIGGVVIPERHSERRSESARMLQKMEVGCAYFISQAVYSPHAVINLCRVYARDCEARGIAPRRVVLTFTPCGRPKTMDFMKWLGITVPTETESAIFSAADPLSASIAVCTDSLRQILDAGVHELVPLGVNIESVSITKSEIAGTIDLYLQLEAVAKRFFP